MLHTVEGGLPHDQVVVRVTRPCCRADPSLSYASSLLSADRFIARIGSRNTASINLFQSLGFKVEKVVEVFDEVHLRCSKLPDLPSLDGRTSYYA